MPLHDWTKVPAGLFHDFHQSWSIRIKDALNAGLLPKGVSALVEQRSGPKESGVLSVERGGKAGGRPTSGIATLEKPSARFVQRTNREIYARRANRIAVKHHLGRTLAVIEIVSPGNKDTSGALREFVKTIDFLRAGIHVLIVDLFPPTPRESSGDSQAIWDEIEDEPFTLPAGQDRVLVSYQTGEEKVAYIEPVGLGERLPDMPLFLTSELHVMTPLEPTYQASWQAAAEELRLAVETGTLPEEAPEE
ncbi:MAG: hypothetical protein U0793_26115 [Gemmataceae bacterium]